MKSMKYSKAHQNFSNRLQKPEALTNPENFLGPNYEAVLNFWMLIESLTEDNWIEVVHRYRTLDPYADGGLWAAWMAAYSAAHHVIGGAPGNAAWNSTRNVAITATGTGPYLHFAWDAAGYATYELISMHILLDQGRELVFVPLFNDL
jgi:hypothetical protein